MGVADLRWPSSRSQRPADVRAVRATYLRILPAHGPSAPSAHERVHELLVHHEDRLADCLESLRTRDPSVAAAVAGDLGWTRHVTAYGDLDFFNKGMAAMETKAHLDLLVARGQATVFDSADGVIFELRVD